MLWKALEFAKKKHGDQVDDSDKSYFKVHVMQVYELVSIVTNDEAVRCAAVLHDTIEDTDTTYEELVQEFSKEVADLVMEVTHESRKDSVGFCFPRLKSQKGIIIKFADRLSNLSRMEAWDEARKEHYINKSKFWRSE